MLFDGVNLESRGSSAWIYPFAKKRKTRDFLQFFFVIAA